ncbi:cation/H(+) antiporter 18-like isoform X2 [Magnolia sinica]|uniref:cation/H(+) antiporter 18-like isoform X2 n=1 Tax=Magnolia sinica TaxID=86752 RepID=UPI00265AD23C|nr:cation/H(+) antiporter 18-like isoform X2 [Magnolia sinica]
MDPIIRELKLTRAVKLPGSMANVTGHACPAPMKATSNGAFQGDNPLDFALPLAILQICLVLVLTRSLAFLLKPLRQPRVIAEIIGGILLGPSALGRSQRYLHAVFPPKSLTVLDTLANLGLLFFLFLVGLELDIKAIRRTGKQALGIAAAGISLPFVLGIGSSFILRNTISKGVDEPPFLVFMGVALSITAFPVLARILAELKLLTTDVGRMAMSAAAVNDVAAWILLALAIALSGSSNTSPIVSLWVLLSGAAFVIVSIYVLCPIFSWIARRSPDGVPIEETYICGILAAVLAAAFVTDAIGIHALFGAFVVGILIPKEGPLAGALVERVEDLVSGLFLPLYFVSSGLKTNVATIQGAQSWGLLVLVIVTACVGKIVGTVVVSLACRVPYRDALTLGFLMNTKGLVELIVLNIGKDRKVLNDQTFAIMVLMALFTTFITTPLVVAFYKPLKRSSIPYKHRTIEREDQDTQLRILACFHSTGNIPTMINLIEASRGTGRHAGLSVYALHLMELSERTSAIRMVHKVRKNGLPFWNKMRGSSADHVVVAFEAFRQLSSVSVRPMTSISALSDMDEDICTSAESKRAAIVILPFHKHQRLDGTLETTRPEFRSVNRRVLEHAPCSVGILVDRGLGGAVHVSASDVASSIVVLFFGGPDDHEALAYGMRMAEHPGIQLTMVHFKTEDGSVGDSITIAVDGDSCTKQKTDDELVAKFQRRAMKDDSFRYEEKVVGNTGAVTAIGEFQRCNLFLVGRMPEGAAAETLTNVSECPELGPVGSLLISSEFPTTASVLVVQQYRGQTTSMAMNLVFDAPSTENGLPEMHSSADSDIDST